MTARRKCEIVRSDDEVIMLSAKSRGMDAAVKVGVVLVASLIWLAAGCSGGYGGTRINDENSSVQPGPDRASGIDGNEPDSRRRR